MKILKFILLLLPFISFGQEIRTETIVSTKKQGAEQNSVFGYTTYYRSTGDVVIFDHVSTTTIKRANLRRLFEHPNFTNDKITKIILEIDINENDVFGDSAGMSIRVPKKECNDAISWLSFDAEDLYICNQLGDLIYDSVRTTSSSTTTESLLIYDADATGDIGTNLQYFDPTSDSFTLAFTPLGGYLKINSAKVHITYEDNNPPSTPTLSGSSNSTSSINLSWNNISNANSYTVFNCNNQQIATVTSTNYTVTGLNSGTTYSYKVRATNSNGNSGFSNCKSVTTQSPVVIPTTPTLNGAANSSSSISLSWNSIANATSYQLYNCNNQLITTRTSTSYTHTGLNSGTAYSYKIRARNSAGASSFSSCKTITTEEEIPVTPSLSGTSNSTSSIDLNWNTISNATSYAIFNCNNELITTTSSNSYTITNLSSGTYYEYKIKANNSAGDSGFSDCISIKTLGCIDAINLMDETLINSYDAASYITITNSFSEANTTFTANAGSIIRLLPNTHLKRASISSIKIQECTITSLKTSINENEKIKNTPEITKTKLIIYPNPTDGLLTINSNQKIISYSIFNSFGRSVLKNNINKNKVIVSIQNLPSGMYLMQITLTSGEIVMKKVIKQ